MWSQPLHWKASIEPCRVLFPFVLSSLQHVAEGHFVWHKSMHWRTTFTRWYALLLQVNWSKLHLYGPGSNNPFRLIGDESVCWLDSLGTDMKGSPEGKTLGMRVRTTPTFQVFLLQGSPSYDRFAAPKKQHHDGNNPLTAHTKKWTV